MSNWLLEYAKNELALATHHVLIQPIRLPQKI